jgi:NhaA family Na+:H+ antiporter
MTEKSAGQSANAKRREGSTFQGRGFKHRVRTTVPRLSRFAVEHLLLLPLGALFALVWVNAAPESYYSFTFAISFAVNDVAMMIFFALMTKEIVEATAPGGVLHTWRRAMLPVIASLGVSVVPALTYSRVVEALDEPVLSLGWPVTLTTDLAFVYFIGRVIFRSHPMIPFLLLLGIAADTLGFLSLALFHPTREIHLGTGMGILAGAISIAAGLRWLRVRSFWPYLLGAGSVSWFGLFWSGWHPALALVPIMPFLPHAARDPGFFVDARPDAKDALSQFEIWWRYPAQVALFFFGLVNAGVPTGSLEAGTLGLPIAVIVGKPLGLFMGVGLAVLGGFHLPQRVGWRELSVGGLIAAIGFSIGLFFCAELFPPGQLRSETSMGVLLSLVAAPLAIVVAMILRVGRFSKVIRVSR